VPYLKKEVAALGYDIISEHNTGIEVRASLVDTMLFNLSLRTASHVMCLIKNFSCRNVDRLYSEVKSLPWEELIDTCEYLSVVAVADTTYLKNSMFAAQKVKDAVVDRIMKAKGARPLSGPKRDNVVISIFWKDDKCWLYIDTTGEKLSNRGYRKIPHTAPLRENLAAGLLIASGYDGKHAFVNPMCGSGTLAIEAALIALNRRPGLLRNNYGIKHIKGFDKNEWETLRGKFKKESLKKLSAPIIAADIDEKAIAAARQNALTAGVSELIEFHVCDFSDTPVPENESVIMLNPEYGVRLNDSDEIGALYKGIGDFFKQKCAGSTGYVFTGNFKAAKQIRLKPSRRLEFFNAKIECRLLEYRLYSGSQRSCV
ncbi:MAG: class I SAM-dependent RNA methyltransferase, partial [Candidatus Omnitrophota bacterium]